MKMKIVFVLLMLPLLIIANPFVANERMQPINPGSNIYIYNTGVIENFSVDFDNEIFSFVDLNKDRDRIYIGKLKENLNPGFNSIITLYSDGERFDMNLTVSPKFFSVNLPLKKYSINDSIHGNVVFMGNNRTDGTGIDSMILFLEGENRNNKKEYTIFKSDSLMGYDYSSGIFIFSLEGIDVADDYSISLIYFVNELSDTIHYAEGLSIESRINTNDFLCIIDSRSKMITNTIEDEYYNPSIEFYPVFFRGEDIDVEEIENFKYTVIFSLSGGYFFYDINNIKTIQDISQIMPVFIFASNVSKILLYDENKEIKDSLENFLNVSFLPETTYISNLAGFKRMPGTEISFAKDNNSEFIDSYIYNQNVHLFMFVPENLNIDMLKNIHSNVKNIKKKEIYGDFLSIERVYNDGYYNYKIEIFDINGRFKGTVNLGNLPLGENIVNVSEIVKGVFNFNNGIYIYKFYKDDICLSSKRLLMLR